MTLQPALGWSSLRTFLALVPSELVVRYVNPEGGRVIIMAEPRRRTAECPHCCGESHQVHRPYRRTLADLPWQGRAVIITVTSRRFRCGSAGCPRRVFVERFPEIAPTHARRTSRLAEIQRHVGLAFGGAAGARLARRLGLSVSGSTLLRLVRRGASFRAKSALPLRAIGIDDWACKRGHRYGSIVCDLERWRTLSICCPIALAQRLRSGCRRIPASR